MFFENDDVADKVEDHLKEGDKQFDSIGEYVVIHKRPMALDVARRGRGLHGVIGIVKPYEALGGYNLEKVHKSRAQSPHTLLFAVQENGSSLKVSCIWWTDDGDKVKTRRVDMSDTVPQQSSRRTALPSGREVMEECRTRGRCMGFCAALRCNSCESAVGFRQVSSKVIWQTWRGCTDTEPRCRGLSLRASGRTFCAFRKPEAPM